MSACKTCQAPVKWARTEAGKNMPLDVDPTTGDLASFPDGNIIVTGWAGPLRLVRVAKATDLPGVRYRSHFASCPNAKAHRR